MALALAGCNGGHPVEHGTVALNRPSAATTVTTEPTQAPGQWPRTWVAYTAGRAAWFVHWSQSRGGHLTGQIINADRSGTEISTTGAPFAGTVVNGNVILAFAPSLGPVRALAGRVSVLRLTLRGLVNGALNTPILGPSTFASFRRDIKALGRDAQAARDAQQMAVAVTREPRKEP
ncbi:MAG TPA: hypothetical protein VMW47_05310 [Verrucomicrobiae bacterium]|nr:hypothetical protein [Verrucomicrobiae bacterium]